MDFAQVHNNCSHGNFFRRHLLYHSQVGKFKPQMTENVPPVTPLLSHVCTCDMGHWTFIIIVYHSQVGQFNHTCETYTFLKVIATFWDLSTVFNSFLSCHSLVLCETIILILLTKFCLYRAGLSETLQVRWSNRKSEIYYIWTVLYQTKSMLIARL